MFDVKANIVNQNRKVNLLEYAAGELGQSRLTNHLCGKWLIRTTS